MPKVKRYLPFSTFSSLGIYVKRYLLIFTFGVVYLFTNMVMTHFGSNFLKLS